MYILTGLIRFFVGVAEVVLGLRFLIRLFGANTRTTFSQWLLDTSAPLLYPFRGMFPAPIVDGRFIFEFTTLFAMLVYALLGYLLLELIAYVHNSTHNRVIVSERQQPKG